MHGRGRTEFNIMGLWLPTEVKSVAALRCLDFPLPATSCDRRSAPSRNHGNVLALQRLMVDAAQLHEHINSSALKRMHNLL